LFGGVCGFVLGVLLLAAVFCVACLCAASEQSVTVQRVGLGGKRVACQRDGITHSYKVETSKQYPSEVFVWTTSGETFVVRGVPVERFVSGAFFDLHNGVLTFPLPPGPRRVQLKRDGREVK
jgi:hypothetical protein